MKLPSPFIQLPVLFDAERLAQEVASLGPDAWRPHPQGYEGNDFLPLISAHGDPQSEAFEGPMRPTPYLASPDRPYLKEALASIGAVFGRTRLMRLSGHAEVVEHVDVNYYWRERSRVHIPIVTQPTVSFHCGDEAVHMAAGECWIFDTWSLHKVINDAERSRIHLVADTVGGEGFWDLVRHGRASDAPAPANWTARKINPTGAKPVLEFESLNIPTVMSPWELKEHLSFLLEETTPGQDMLAEVVDATAPFLQNWRALWSAYGEAEVAWPRYRKLIEKFLIDLQATRVDQLLMRNEVDFVQALKGMVLNVALSPGRRARAPV